MTEAIFGPIVTDVDVEDAVIATLEEWAPTYLREMERRKGFKEFDFPDVASWRAADTAEDRFPEQMIPAVQVMLTTDTEINTSAETASALFKGSVDVLVASTEPEAVRRMAAYYQFALGLCLQQHWGLDGSVKVGGFGWERAGIPAVGKPDERWLALGSIAVNFLISDIFSPLLGPAAPQPEDGKGEPPPFRKVKTHELELTEIK